MNAMGPHRWQVNIGSGNGLVPSGNKPLPEPMLTKLASLGHNELNAPLPLSPVEHWAGWHLPHGAQYTATLLEVAQRRQTQILRGRATQLASRVWVIVVIHLLKLP